MAVIAGRPREVGWYRLGGFDKARFQDHGSPSGSPWNRNIEKARSLLKSN